MAIYAGAVSTTLFNIAWMIVLTGAGVLLFVRSRDRKSQQRRRLAESQRDQSAGAPDDDAPCG